MNKTYNIYIGIDVGSVSTNLIVMDSDLNVIRKEYIRTQGRPIQILKESLEELSQNLPKDSIIAGVGCTGSGRELAGALVGADVIKNEITAHGIAALTFVPEVKTVIEIGGQDSKIIIIRDNIVTDFAMNTVCAAGTGSFLDRQAARLNIPIEEFGNLALKSKSPVRIAGRCAVFAESDMVHKQQMGHGVEDIVKGLCVALVRNYLNNVGKGKEILPNVIFQGGVAANMGIKLAFEDALNLSITVPKHFDVMGALGAAILAKNETDISGRSKFRGFETLDLDFRSASFECDRCPNRCEVVEIRVGDKIVASWGDRCGRWGSRE
ncbi:MAG: 2-hydroxyglutaryl-CoA dehydratase [Clostridiales bacterium]|nr:2-hydroxyglutaryl-CoA dehydratase [Clostridiales bacterium]